jgi:tetratricopeptide (TPR) repeat protein
MFTRYLIVAAACVAVYAHGLAAPKVLDDLVSIDDNPQIRELWNPAVLMPERELPTAGRPLPNLSLAINYALGGTEPTGYRAVNLLFHILCAGALFAVTRRVLRLPRLRERWGDQATDAAFAASLIWALHPLNSEVVNYLTQRTEARMALCLLLTIYAAIRAVDGPRRRWTTAAVAACMLGTLCKESMATAPVLVVLLDRLFVYPTWREAWRERRALYAGLAASWVVLAGILATGPRIRSTGFAAGVTAWTYLLNQARMIVRYLHLAVWPDSLVVYYGPPQPLALVDVLPQFVFIAVLIVATLVALRYRPWLGCAGVWFFVTLAPSSSIVPIVTEVGAERRMYLPLLAIVVPLCVAATQTRVPRRVLGALLALVAIGLGTVTFARTSEYASSLTLAERTLERWPSAVAHEMVGEQLLIAGRAAEGVPHLRLATAGAPRAHFTLGTYLFNEGRFDEAVAELREFIAREPLLLEVPQAHLLIARVYASRRQWSEAAAEARLSIAKAPRNADARRMLADVLFNNEDPAGAAAAYASYLALRADDFDAWTNLGIVFASQRRFAEARAAFQRAVDLRPNDGQAHRNLATLLLDAGLAADAAAEARRAVALRPDDPVSRDLLAQALARQAP